MIKVNQAVIVEGKYDKIKLSGIVDGLIVVTGGFQIFKDEEKRKYLKNLAEERGLLILTDSDAAGFMIRNHLKSFIPEDRIFNAYVPKIFGKEKRKTEGSKEGTLGVEGMDKEIILEAIKNSGALDMETESAERYAYTLKDLFNLGLTGSDNSKARKIHFLKLLALPEHMNNNALLKYMNTAPVEKIEKALKEFQNGI